MSSGTAIGKEQQVYEIPSLNIKAEGLRTVNMLADYPLELDCNGYKITVPEPEAYVLQKLYTNPTRTPESKKEKDIQAIEELLNHVNRERMKQIFDKMTAKQQKTVTETCENRLNNRALEFISAADTVTKP